MTSSFLGSSRTSKRQFSINMVFLISQNQCYLTLMTLLTIQTVHSTICQSSNLSTNAIMITRIFPHWPMEQIYIDKSMSSYKLLKALKLVRNGTKVSLIGSLMGFVMGSVMLFSLITQPCFL